MELNAVKLAISINTFHVNSKLHEGTVPFL